MARVYCSYCTAAFRGPLLCTWRGLTLERFEQSAAALLRSCFTSGQEQTKPRAKHPAWHANSWVQRQDARKIYGPWDRMSDRDRTPRKTRTTKVSYSATHDREPSAQVRAESRNGGRQMLCSPAVRAMESCLRARHALWMVPKVSQGELGPFQAR